MATWKYGPVKVEEDCNGYLDPKTVEYAVEYQTTADILVILQNGEWGIGLEYLAAREVSKMIIRWYLGYVLCYNNKFIDKLLKGEIIEKD